MSTTMMSLFAPLCGLILDLNSSSLNPESTANYRVDRMDRVEVVEESVLSEEALAKSDGAAAYTEEVFKMFSGERKTSSSASINS